MTKDIPCPVCGKMYTRNDSMKLHMKQIHKVNQTKEIVETPIGFIKFDEEQLDKNCNNTMTFKEQHICDVCGYKHDYKSKVIPHRQWCEKKTNKRKDMDDKVSTATKYRKLNSAFKAVASSPADKIYFEKKLKQDVEKVNEDEILNLIKDLNISENKLVTLVSFFRKKHGRSIFTPNVRKALRNRKIILKDHFVTEEFGFINSNGEVVKRALSYIQDLNLFIDMLSIERGNVSGECQINELSMKFSVVSDLKCIAILLGITSCSSMYPRLYGECVKVRHLFFCNNNYI